MQSALAVRDTILICSDIMVFVVIYFVTMTAVVSHFDLALMALVPVLAGVVPAGAVVLRAAPEPPPKEPGRCAQPDDQPHHRCLHQYQHRQTVRTRPARGWFRQRAPCRSAPLTTVYRQMRLVTGIEVINHTLNAMLLIAGTAGGALWLWSRAQSASARLPRQPAMALQLNGIAHWIMGNVNLFEQIGALVQDGISTLSRPIAINDAADAQPLKGHARRNPASTT